MIIISRNKAQAENIYHSMKEQSDDQLQEKGGNLLGRNIKHTKMSNKIDSHLHRGMESEESVLVSLLFHRMVAWR